MTGSKHKRHDDGALPLAKTKLADAIATISHLRLHEVVGDGRPKHVWLSSRYDDLAEAVEGARGGSGGKWSHQLPFWADAFVLLREIETAVAVMHPAPNGWLGWTKPRLAALDQRRWRPQDCKLMQQHTNQLDGFSAKIDALFSPKPISLPDACPECQTKTVYRNQDGEQVRSPALQINADGCTCGNCHANWPVERLRILGKILEDLRHRDREYANAS